MKLSNLKKISKQKAKRIGRGIGSGKGGHTVGKGQKGQRARSGFSKMRNWIKGNVIKTLPKLRGIGRRSNKRGFFIKNKKFISFNVGQLNLFNDGEIVSVESLIKKGLIKAKTKKIEVKILGNGELKRKLTIDKIKTSKLAAKKITEAGGKIQ